jgi:hypothetical protein
MRRFHDLRVIKALETQISFMRVPGGFVEVLQLGIDFHSPLRRAGIRRCMHFETLHGTLGLASRISLANALLSHHVA